METVCEMISQQIETLDGGLTDEFIDIRNKHLFWKELSEYCDFTIDLLRVYQHLVNWECILKIKIFNENFLREMSANFTSDECWKIVSQYQKLSIEFMHDYAERLDWSLIELYQNVSRDFLNERVYISSEEEEMSDGVVEQHSDCFSDYDDGYDCFSENDDSDDWFSDDGYDSVS